VSTVFVTKYWQTLGIVECTPHANDDSNSKYRYVKWPGGMNGWLQCVINKDCFAERYQAEVAVYHAVQTKIASLEKQLEALNQFKMKVVSYAGD
jgi:hypothetical protein